MQLCWNVARILPLDLGEAGSDAKPCQLAAVIVCKSEFRLAVKKLRNALFKSTVTL